jgi:cytochrome c-type biogenesis protein
MSLDEVQLARRNALIHSLLFIAGFTLIFLALGATATVFGRVLLVYRDWISRIGGMLIIVFGLYLLGAFQLGFLARERRMHIADKPMGYLGTVLVGIAFGAGWTPCIGPILGTVLGFAAQGQDLGRAALLLTAYSLGLGLAFLAVGLAFGRFAAPLAWVKRHAKALTLVSAAVLAVFGLILLLDELPRVTAWLSDVMDSIGLRSLVEIG